MPDITPLAGQPGLPPFPTWPPPSGGYPVTKWEMGPIAGSPAPGRTFPAGSFIDGNGVFINPQTMSIVQSMGLRL